MDSRNCKPFLSGKEKDMSAPRFMREYISDKEKRLRQLTKDGGLTAEKFSDIQWEITKIVRAYEAGMIQIDEAMTALIEA